MMNKNTIIAIVLSTIVVLASLILQPMLFPNTANNVAESENVTEETSAVKVEEDKKDLSLIVEDESDKNVEEQFFEITTKNAQIVLTNRGGDMISYKLLNHIDVDTKDGIQMVDNVSKTNRACAVAFGDVNSPINNEIFNVTHKDENVYFFTKAISIKKEDGSVSKVILGKRYTFDPESYVFKLDILIHGDDIENLVYTLRTSPQIGPHFDPKLNRYENRQFISFNGEKAKRQVISAKQFKSYNKDYLWNGIGGKYFVNLVVPLNPEKMDNSYYSTLINEENNYSNAQAICVRKPFSEDVEDSYYMYYGPREEKALKIFNVAENNSWKLSGLKLNECLNSNGWLGWLETILKWFMEVINKFVHNWGVSIIIMTILIKLLMFPFTKKQSLGTLKMQEIQPKIQAIQAKYKDNQQKLQQEMAKIYKDNGYNPMSGCLPMLVQFLILFAMYNLFNNYFEFRGSSFIPNWIEDLSSGDSIYTLKFDIPFFGNQVRILPFIYLASQLLFGKITGNGGTAAPGTSQAQMQMMMYVMPIMFFVMFYNAPSGLLLYWTVSNIFQMGQQIIINKTMKQKKAELAAKKNK
ncbi:MAG: membrane protein insertase YidC [Treponema sp.]|nr:membrane protein insertase YidC [Spirochaetia bacterium]MDY4768499.1 membrane protein insertase YidC [Treponema sp.]